LGQQKQAGKLASLLAFHHWFGFPLTQKLLKAKQEEEMPVVIRSGKLKGRRGTHGA